MTQVSENSNNEVIVLQAIDRIELAVEQFKRMIKDYDAYQVSELEPLVQQMLTVEDANNMIKATI